MKVELFCKETEKYVKRENVVRIVSTISIEKDYATKRVVRTNPVFRLTYSDGKSEDFISNLFEIIDVTEDVSCVKEYLRQYCRQSMTAGFCHEDDCDDCPINSAFAKTAYFNGTSFEEEVFATDEKGEDEEW